MKRWGVVVSLFVLGMGCGPGGSVLPGNEPEPEPVPSTADIQRVSLAYADGYTFSQRYTYVPAQSLLQGHWSSNGPGQGYRSRDEEVRLSAGQALALEERLGGLRLDTSSPRGHCLSDWPAIQIQFVETSGRSRVFDTDPANNNCGRQVFVRAEDAQAVLDTCHALLPVPEL